MVKGKCQFKAENEELVNDKAELKSIQRNYFEELLNFINKIKAELKYLRIVTKKF